MIHLKEVTVSFQHHSVFHALDLVLESGVNYLISGRNGSGKTTLLKTIAGKIQPRGGKVLYDFIDDQLDWDEKFQLRKHLIHDIPSHALHEVVHSPELFYQQRYYSIENTPLPTVRDYLGDLIDNLAKLQLPDSLHLEYLLDLEMTKLSNGQVKKLIILKHLLNSIPAVLVMDYPFEGLDIQSRTELCEFLDHLATAHNIQLIIADHEHSELPRAISKKVVLNQSAAVVTNIVRGEELPITLNAIHHPVTRKDSEPVVEMLNVKIQYGEKIILQHLNWKINKGERWALTGKNGSGKTTLFSLIYADHPMAYSEQVFLFGKRRGTGESIWDIKKRISYLGPEHMHYLDYATEQLTVTAYLEGVKSEPMQLLHLINYFAIQDLLPIKLRHLSHGQLQLVLLMNLFLSQKELLLLDEPFQFLDLNQKQLVSEYLETHMDESVTLVLITHFNRDVERWTNHRLAL